MQRDMYLILKIGEIVTDFNLKFCSARFPGSSTMMAGTIFCK